MPTKEEIKVKIETTIKQKFEEFIAGFILETGDRTIEEHRDILMSVYSLGFEQGIRLGIDISEEVTLNVIRGN